MTNPESSGPLKDDYKMMNAIRAFSANDIDDVKIWFRAAKVSDFPENGGACVRYRDMQIAVFNFTRRNEWYACQNLCPHKMQMILSRGVIGSQGDEPKVACPFHKRTFSLKSGQCLNADADGVTVFPVRIEDGFVCIGFTK